jgi:glutaryl-CoA dehydrogenase
MDNSTAADLFATDDLLTQDEKLVRDSVRAWVDEKAAPIMDSHFEAGTFPRHLVQEMADLNMFGATLPEEYGCASMNNVAYGLLMQELERGDSALRSFASVQGSLAMYAIYAFGSQEQKSSWLPRLASGEKIGCFGLTEPDHGSDPGSMTTRAVKTGDRWVLNGAKAWITNRTIADVAVVWAKVDGRVRGFLVEKDTSGFSAPEIKHKMSLRASVTSELIFEDCAIPTSNELPLAQGLRAPLTCLDQARYGIAWGALGAAMACYETALRYTRERVQFGKPIAGFQLVQEKLVYMLSEITKGRLLALRLGRMKDEGRNVAIQTSMAKRNNVSIALETARMARDLLGANGVSLEFPVIRHMCNLEAVKTYEGTHDIHTLIIGEAITGIPAFTGQ